MRLSMKPFSGYVPLPPGVREGEPHDRAAALVRQLGAPLALVDLRPCGHPVAAHHVIVTNE